MVLLSHGSLCNQRASSPVAGQPPSLFCAAVLRQLGQSRTLPPAGLLGLSPPLPGWPCCPTHNPVFQMSLASYPGDPGTHKPSQLWAVCTLAKSNSCHCSQAPLGPRSLDSYLPESEVPASTLHFPLVFLGLGLLKTKFFRDLVACREERLQGLSSARDSAFSTHMP
jgi:hypothetical protein